MLLALIQFTPLPKLLLQPAPFLGYNTWNAFGSNINEQKIMETADLLVEKGLLAAGYSYLVIDDGYLLQQRDQNGKIIIDPAKFPHGMKYVADYVHSKGLKFGMYNSAGTHTCMGLAGSFGHETIDAETFAFYGVDFLKYDFCNNPIINTQFAPDIQKLTVGMQNFSMDEAQLLGYAELSAGTIYNIGGSGEAVFTYTNEKKDEELLEIIVEYSCTDQYRILLIQVNDGEDLPILVQKGINYASIKTNFAPGDNKVRLHMTWQNADLAHYSYARMGDALIRSGKNVTFGICEWGSNQPYLWAQDVGHQWRTSYDINQEAGQCDFKNVVSNYESAVQLYNYSGENSYNDPDMLCIGLEGLSYDENIAHISLWAMVNAPLQIGADLAVIDDKYVKLLVNAEMLSVNQDEMHLQARPAEMNENYDVLVKQLVENRVAILLFNRGQQVSIINFEMSGVSRLFEIPGWDDANAYSCKEIWTKKQVVVQNDDQDALSFEVGGHSTALFICVIE